MDYEYRAVFIGKNGDRSEYRMKIPCRDLRPVEKFRKKVMELTSSDNPAYKGKPCLIYRDGDFLEILYLNRRYRFDMSVGIRTVLPRGALKKESEDCDYTDEYNGIVDGINEMLIRHLYELVEKEESDD